MACRRARRAEKHRNAQVRSAPEKIRGEIRSEADTTNTSATGLARTQIGIPGHLKSVRTKSRDKGAFLKKRKRAIVRGDVSRSSRPAGRTHTSSKDDRNKKYGDPDTILSSHEEGRMLK